MADATSSPYSPRSRAPIDEAGIKWWELYGDEQNTIENTQKSAIPNERPGDRKDDKKTDKSTSTSTPNVLGDRRKLTSKVYKDFIGKTIVTPNPKDIVLKKWREEQAKAKYEQARKAVINSLKEKFGAHPSHANVHSIPDANKTDIRKIIPTIIITGDNVEETSNLNARVEEQEKLSFKDGSYRDDIGAGSGEGVCHARKLQMGPGGGVAQWRPAPRGSRAAGAAGGLRGFAREDMPVSCCTDNYRPVTKDKCT